MTSILQDLLSEDLLTESPRVLVSGVTDLLISQTSPIPRSTSIGASKSLLEFYDLVRQAKDDYEKRAHVTEGSKVNYTSEEPEADSKTESITFGLQSRLPGSFGRGAPGENSIRNLRPLIRETKDDSTNPGYKLITLGYWHDNIVRFTCWARTNKAANARAIWLENMMEDYTWWFKLSGVNQLIYQGQGQDIVENINNNRWYGRPVDYYVRTETIRIYSEKTLEKIIVELGVNVR